MELIFFTIEIQSNYIIVHLVRNAILLSFLFTKILRKTYERLCNRELENISMILISCYFLTHFRLLI